MSRSAITCVAAALALCAAVSAQNQKRAKDQGESDIYAQVTKDVTANDYAKAVADLDTWKQKYPDTELADDRQLLYLQAYYKAAVAIQQIAEPTAPQLALAEQSGRFLMSYDKKPPNVAEDAWAQARAQLQGAGKGALVYAALVPAAQAVKQNDCAAAEAAAKKALGEWPESAQGAWYLGLANLCAYKKTHGDASAGIYHLARAAAVDPAKGMVDPKWQQTAVDPYLLKVYNGYHGPDADGLKQLKELAAQSPFPPEGFKLKSVTEIAQEKQAQFEQSNPQLALWMRIKGALADSNGEQYFNSELKDSAVPRLRGVLVEARPACRPKAPGRRTRNRSSNGRACPRPSRRARSC
ncbi:MAG: hypothetical protein LAQ30_31565 [Acidobacteriia bacterium]|nr:hypothetical protein [Terriglobia bacterium]